MEFRDIRSIFSCLTSRTPGILLNTQIDISNSIGRYQLLPIDNLMKYEG